MQDGRIPKDVLYGELHSGTRPVGRPCLRYKDVCKRDMKFARINLDMWEGRAADREAWRFLVKECSSAADKDMRDCEDRKSQDRKLRHSTLAASHFVCTACDKELYARIGLVAHQRHCMKLKK